MNARIENVVLLMVVFAGLSGMADTLRGQTATGQITGTVRDSTDAVIPEVKVTVNSQLTGETRETTTNDSGGYTFALLPVGLYTVAAESQGFRLARQTDNRLNVNQVLRIDLRLEVGAVTETVEVHATAAAVDSDSAAIGQVVTQRQVTDLPLNGRNFLQLLFLGAGAVEVHGEQGDMRKGSGDAISIMGARPTSNNYTLDGTANTDTALNTPAVVLSVDAIEEFKEQTSTYSAESGFSANQINIISKSGTNAFHGSLFWFMRNNVLDARSFFQADIPPLRQNQFGFVAGGPVYIPKVYDGRNKTFFLANYEGSRVREGFDRFGVVPSPDNLAGRFDHTVVDPFTGDQFPNNVIPQTRNSRLANVAVSTGFWPSANINLPQGNYRQVGSDRLDTNQQTYRFDQMLGAAGTIFGRVTLSDFVNTNSQGLTPAADVFFDQEATNWQISHTIPISPTVVNQFRIGYLEFTADQFGPPMDDGDLQRLGLTGVFTNLSERQKVTPFISFTSGLSLGGGAVNAVTQSNQPMIDFSNGTTMIRGTHSFNFGFAYRSWSVNRDLALNFLGGYTFSGDFSNDPIGDMLLGVYDNASAFVPGAFSNPDRAGNPRFFNFKYFAPYVQDDWKVTSRLTLNLGLRWDFRTLPYETYDHMIWWNPDYKPGGFFVADKRLETEGVIDDSGYYQLAGRRNPHPSSKKVWAPRFGFAYRPFGERTVIRGGYGVFFDSAEEREIDGAADFFPYISNQFVQNSFGQALGTTDELFPDLTAPGPATPEKNTFLATQQSYDKRNPYVQQWTLSIQRALGPNSTVEFNYVGSKATHLLMRNNIAQAFAPDPNNITPISARKPYPNFGIMLNSLWGGNASYNSFNTKFEHRSNNLIVTTAYTWAKSIDSKSASAGIGSSNAGWQGFMDNHDIRRDRGLSDFDTDHRLVTSFVYNLPFGRGQRFLSSASGVTDALLGGWQINGIVMFQRGFPYGINALDLGGVLESFANRAHVVGDPEPDGFDRTISKWFNTDAFAQPAIGVYGNSGRKVLRGNGVNNWDLGAFKNIRLRESVTLQLRLESFNTWNHTQFLDPDNNLGSSLFGVIGSTRPGRINQVGAKILW